MREPYEFELFKDWDKLGFKTKPENIPLSRFPQFIHDVLENQNKDQDIVFVCRSGSRSHQAAMILRRLGFKKAKHIKGGLALSL